MKVDGQLARRIENGEFIVTAEHAPRTTATLSTTETALKALGGKLTAVNLGDNQHGVAMSSLAASAAALKTGLEPVLPRERRSDVQAIMIGWYREFGIEDLEIACEAAAGGARVFAASLAPFLTSVSTAARERL